MSKPKIGFYWCASCGGCEEAVVDLAEDVLKVVAAVDIVFWPCAMDFKRSDLEAMADGEMAACFVNGAIRSSEQREMAELCRRKAQALVAFGSCAHTGGIPGLANLSTLESILQTVYGDGPVQHGESGEDPAPGGNARSEGGSVTLPTLDRSVKTLDQVVPVDYYLPGCPPPVKLIAAAVMALLEGNLPPRGAVLAPDMALCKECPRIDSKPQDPFLRGFKRPHQVLIDPEKCFLAQGILCMGPATRDGCDHACIGGNMPCTGCLGPVSRTRDYGAAILSAVSSLVDSNDEQEIAAILEKIPDPAGTFNRYSLPSSMLYQCVNANGKTETEGLEHGPPDHHRSDHATGRPRQDRHLPQRRGERRSGLFPGAGAAGLREVRPGPAGRGHAADHLADLRRLPHGPPRGRRQGPRRPLPGPAAPGRAARSASWSTTPSCSKTTPCTSISLAGPISSSAPTPPRPNGTSSAWSPKSAWKSAPA